MGICRFMKSMVDVADFMSDCSRLGKAEAERQRADQAAENAKKEQIRAGVATELANESLEDANRATDAAKSAQRDAIARKLVMQSRAVLQGQRAATTDMALLFAAAGYRLKPDNEAFGGLQSAPKATPRGL